MWKPIQNEQTIGTESQASPAKCTWAQRGEIINYHLLWLLVLNTSIILTIIITKNSVSLIIIDIPHSSFASKLPPPPPAYWTETPVIELAMPLP